MKTVFHLSLPCNDVTETKAFYKQTIGCEIGRSSHNWVDVNLFDHQVTFTNAGKFNFNNPNYVFEGKILPSFHFGIIVPQNEWKQLYKKMKDTDYEVVTKTKFLDGKKGKHLSFFIKDPNGYMLEFKTFENDKEVFSG